MDEDMDRNPTVYILASKYRGVLYIGVTSNLQFRIWQHRQKLIKGFTRKYNIDRLVWFEQYEQMYDAIVREKRIKKWNRDWKIRLVELTNPGWHDLYDEILS